MKLYIIGPPASGKTTLSKVLSHKYKTKAHELDLIVFDDANGHKRRTKEEIEKRYNKILEKDSWIIEDICRKSLSKGLEECDKIYYLKLPKLLVYFRIFKRWFKQKIGKERYNYPPTLFQLFDMYRTLNSYYKKEKEKLERILKYKEKVRFLSNKEIKRLINNK